ncbi:antirestriction protein [Lysobacter sp. KIS68-7]|uniref:antirestriction protein n=1 Tax=Lysobacter sp. KIS68-7 TaxID=2904252 RepID=UPI001E2C3A5F|nr:antirestriction protein [Lysobacter sp. KIS68-7]UHQ20149.1 antirestriction protein [Lysobacter sp. KIS68-7]
MDRVIQATIHRWLRKACIDKHDHPLRFVSLTNGGFYLAPCVGALRIRIDAQRNDVTMSGDAAGIVATLLALCALGHGDHYRRLRAYAGDHVESTTILAAVD